MKKIFVLLFFITVAGYAQNRSDIQIDPSLIKTKNLLWDLHTLSKAPEVEWLDQKSKVQSLLYNSVDYEGRGTQVFAYYSNPDILAGKSGKRKFPGIVLIHGGGGTAFKMWVEKWAAEGYAAIAMDLSGNGPDGKKLLKAGPDQSHESKFDKIVKGDIKDVWTYHAVASSILAHSFLLSRPEVNQTRTSVTGISWGGYLTCIVGAIDNRFKAAVPVYGCAFYDESDVFKAPLEQLPPVSKTKWMQFFDPSAYLPYAREPFLFLNGNKDKFYNVVPYKKTYDLIPKTNRNVLILPDMKHSHDWGWEPHEIRYFLENILNDQMPLTKIGQIQETNDTITASYEAPVSVWYADFYYTNDTTSTNEQRSWQKQPVKINPEQRTLQTQIPKESFKYGFFHLKDHRNVSASSEFIIH